MEKRVPFSFIVFILNLAMMVLAFVASAILIALHFGSNYAAFVIFPVIISLTWTTAGIYSGFVNKYDELRVRKLNRVGLWGNISLYSVVVLLITYVLIKRYLGQ